jgi:hypothetical protein
MIPPKDHPTSLCSWTRVMSRSSLTHHGKASDPGIQFSRNPAVLQPAGAARRSAKSARRAAALTRSNSFVHVATKVRTSGRSRPGSRRLGGAGTDRLRSTMRVTPSRPAAAKLAMARGSTSRAYRRRKGEATGLTCCDQRDPIIAAPVGSCLEYAARHIFASYAQPPVQRVRTRRRGPYRRYACGFPQLLAVTTRD